jgi:hypothetical protein
MCGAEWSACGTRPVDGPTTVRNAGDRISGSILPGSHGMAGRGLHSVELMLTRWLLLLLLLLLLLY